MDLCEYDGGDCCLGTIYYVITFKGGFFSESVIRFLKSPKKIFQKTILSLKFKFHVQDSFLEFFFGDLEI